MKIFRFLLILLIIVPCAWSFELRNIDEVSQDAFISWDLSNGPISISLDRRGSDNLKLTQAEQAVVAALNEWQSVSGQNMTFQYAGVTSLQSGSGTDGVNSIEWIESGWAYSKYTLAVTSYSYYVDDPPTLFDADILMNGQDFKWVVTGADNEKTFDVQQTLLHEVGHALGLAHTSVANARMFPYIIGTPRRLLSKDDKQGLRFLYGALPSSFSLVSPVRRARYVSNISSRGLPLPVLRWTQGPGSNYVIEFSNTSRFTQKIEVNAGAYLYYPLSPSLEKKLLKLSTVDRIFWRVRSGDSVTPTRSFYFI